MVEKTLVIIKPDAVKSEWTDSIIDRYREADLTVIAKIKRKLDPHRADQLYEEHRDKHFFAGLTLAMSSGYMVALVLEGDDAIQRVRKLNGATDPRQAEAGTIRHDFLSAGGPFNTVHASDSPESAKREISLFTSWFL